VTPMQEKKIVAGSAGTGRPGRPTRLACEDEPAVDYIERLRACGRRPGESLYGFEIRLAGVTRGRELWLNAIRKSCGSIRGAAEVLGIDPHASWSTMRQVGLSTEVLLSLVAVTVQREEG